MNAHVMTDSTINLKFNPVHLELIKNAIGSVVDEMVLTVGFSSHADFAAIKADDVGKSSNLSLIQI